MLKIKLLCKGKKHQRTYSIVAANSLSKRDGKFISFIGYYIPYKKQIYLNKNNLKLMLNYGAYPTATVRHLLKWALNCYI